MIVNMSFSKNIKHYRHCTVIQQRYFRTENSNIRPTTTETGGTEAIYSEREHLNNSNLTMSVRNIANSQSVKIWNQLKSLLQKLKSDQVVNFELNKELAIMLQKFKPSIYGTKIVRDLGVNRLIKISAVSSTSDKNNDKQNEVESKELANKFDSIQKSDGYKLPNMFNGFSFGAGTSTTAPVKIRDTSQLITESKLSRSISPIPKWKLSEQPITKSSISSRTNHVISMIATAETEQSLLKRIEALSQHLDQFPIAKNQAVKNGAIRLLLRVREELKRKANTNKNVEIQSAVAEAFARLGYVDPPHGYGIRILAIDGGGIRGIAVIEMLRKIEQLTGQRIHELFDYVCGVSTGAILSAALIANRKSLDNVSKYYKELSTKIFTQNALLGTSNLVLKQSYYDTAMWEKMLKEYLGEIEFIKTSRDEKCPKMSAVSAIVNKSQLSAFIFRNYELPYRVCSQYMGSSDCAVWQAVRASAAAPTYFEEFMLNGLLHQDGGIMVNNPTAIAIHEAKQLWPNHPIQCVLSFGTGRVHPVAYADAHPDHAATSTNNITSSSWKNKFLKILDSATDTEGVHTVLNDLLDPGVYYRFNPYLTEYLSMVEIRPEKLTQLEQDVAMYVRRNEDKFEQAAKQLTLKRDSRQKLFDWVHKQQIILGLKSTI